jgi:hypothetical protein
VSLGHFIHVIFFGEEEKAKKDGRREEWRHAIHENRNEVMRSSGAARISKKASDESLKVQGAAIRLLECVRDKVWKGE